ncbi:PLP-dependent aminotransferase family protein [Tropicimonas sp. TH_r6]|uniref:aminotransferase-like domain-containing protein n=1 Tax=Tropicimonas sp. TH_r6 TaxID=3082085 RepID=UPI0029537DAF|nr:PLP-dependent aminotransferase family protein [Tropicimonas sp. TH_r6]MDV7143946.1 PLP-dependent aminotransferase family protein [Tropicimonas sp. TH_r6]
MSDTKWIEGADLTAGPKYRALADHIESAISTGLLTEGAKLPPVRQLAWTLGITPGTVARAYALLTNAGRLEAVVGRGTFVASGRPALPEEEVWAHPTESPDGPVNLFSPRLPDMGQVAAIRAAMHAVADGPMNDLLEYPNREAFEPARRAAVGWLSDVMLGSIGHKDLVLCHGGQNAVSLVMQAVLREPRPTVLVEELSYPGFRRAAEMLRVDVADVAMDAEGLIPEEIERVARRTGARLLCTSAEMHNPTALHTPRARREAIVAACRRVDVQILEDDCYRTAPARAPSYRALWPEGAWYVASISKTISPALRIGFAVAPEGQHAALRRAAEYGFFGLARPLAELARIVLSDPQTRETAIRVRSRLADYVRVAVNTLGGHDLTWREDVPFLWLRLPRGWRAAEFARAAERAGIQIRSAEVFTLREGRAPHAVRISINGQIPLDRFEAAMTALRELLDDPPEEISI